MTVGLLLQEFQLLADAPDATGHLRRFVLDLAIRGKLVPQLPSDEPAEELVKRLAGTTEAARASNGRKPPRAAPAVAANAAPFGVPEAWMWVPLIEVCNVTYGFAFDSSQFRPPGTGRPLIRIRDISSTDTEAYFIGPFDERYLVQPGDYLVGMDGDFNLRRWDGPEALLNQRVMRLSSWKLGISPDWMRMPLQATLHHLHRSTSQTTVKHLSAKQVNGIRLPLPPLAEQHRIVARVDKLVALCDQLEASQEEREDRRNLLLAASVKRLTSPVEGGLAAAEDVRFFLDHSPRLITKPHHIGVIRQAIRDLAVHGRLVPQHPGDEPALQLVGRLKAGNSRQRMAMGVNARSPADQPVAGVRFPLPTQWMWAPFGDIARIQSHLVDPASFGDLPHIAPDNIESGTGRLLPFGTIRESAVTSNKHLFEPGVILYSKIRPALAKATLVDFGGLCSADMYPILSLIDRRYLHMCMLSEVFVEQSIQVDNRVAMPKINQAALSVISIPVPPLAEQQRIVAKVDQLMGMCDQLQAAVASLEDRRRRLLEALLYETLDLASVPDSLQP